MGCQMKLLVTLVTMKTKFWRTTKTTTTIMTYSSFFQQTSTQNIYRPYPNSTDFGDNQVPDNPNYGLFFRPTTTI